MPYHTITIAFQYIISLPFPSPLHTVSCHYHCNPFLEWNLMPGSFALMVYERNMIRRSRWYLHQIWNIHKCFYVDSSCGCIYWPEFLQGRPWSETWKPILWLLQQFSFTTHTALGYGLQNVCMKEMIYLCPKVKFWGHSWNWEWENHGAQKFCPDNWTNTG